MSIMIENEKIIIREATNEESAVFAGHAAGFAADKYYAVADKNGTVVGAVGEKLHTDWNMHGIVFLTLPEYLRNGYAAAAVRAFTRWFYDSRSEDMFVSVIDLENVPAIRTIERAGYDYIRTMGLENEADGTKQLYHMYVCSRATVDAGAPPKGCCCGCGGHTDNE